MNKRKLIVLVFMMVTSVCFAQAIKQKDKYGASNYFEDGSYLKQNDKYSRALYYYDEFTIKQKDKYGNSLFYIDGQVVKQKDKYGESLYYFDGNTIRVKDKYGKALYFIDGQTLKIKISGHTDNHSSEEYNLKLSMMRSESVKAYLVKKGINANRFTLEFYGESKPIESNESVKGQEKNRRVEMTFKYD